MTNQYSTQLKMRLSDEQLAEAQSIQRETGQLLDEVLVELGYCAPESVLEVLAWQAGRPLVAVAESDLDPQVIDLVPAELALRYQALPLTETPTSLRVAVADPFNVVAADDIRMVTSREVELVFSSPSQIRRFVEEYYTRRMLADTTENDVQVLDETENEIGDLERMAKEATVVKLVNLILRQAVQERASDVHVEPFERGMQVRYRIDGILHQVPSPRNDSKRPSSRA